MNLVVVKRCPSCKEEKPATSEFWHLNAARPDGLSSICKECKKISDKERNRRNQSMSRLDRLRKKAIKNLEKKYKKKAIESIYSDENFLREKEAIESTEDIDDLL